MPIEESSPKVSILIPNLNNRPYLDERVQCIMDQTIKDWELIIVDNYSDDGAWEFFRELAKQDARVRISQAPRKGMYANWNNCIRLAKGEYVYIATSDDTMTPDFLEVMTAALDKHPECDLAHCKLKIIDENGDPHPTLNWDKFFCAAYFGDLIHHEHIRVAPHDGLLHCGVKTVYTSITQLLIRKKLFDRVGVFLTDYGSIADFEWEMRASLVANTIHIPEYLATWRVHREQWTNHDFLHSAEYRTKLLELIDHAVDSARKINPVLLKGIKKKKLKYLYLKEKFIFELREQKQKENSIVNRYKIACKWLILHPEILMEYLWNIKSGFKFAIPQRPFITPGESIDISRRILSKYGVEKNCKIIER